MTSQFDSLAWMAAEIASRLNSQFPDASADASDAALIMGVDIDADAIRPDMTIDDVRQCYLLPASASMAQSIGAMRRFTSPELPPLSAACESALSPDAPIRVRAVKAMMPTFEIVDGEVVRTGEREAIQFAVRCE